MVGAGDGSVGFCKHAPACCFYMSEGLSSGKTQAGCPFYIDRLAQLAFSYKTVVILLKGYKIIHLSLLFYLNV